MNSSSGPRTFPLLVLLLLISSGCGEPLDNSGNKPYNVLLVTIDTLRADHLGAYGYGKIKTPHIDGLASEGIRFEYAYTPCPVTLPAHTSLLTGTYPFFHGVRNNGIFRARDSLTTLAEVLKEHGYATGAVIGAVVMDSGFGLDQGFDLYDDDMGLQEEAGAGLFFAERKADEVTRRAFSFMKANTHHPFFLWAHYFDPHVVYDPPAPFNEQYKDVPYDGEIAFVDEQIGVLLRMLALLDLEEDTLLVLTSDHGEGLMEHGEETHGGLVYDATLRVPLVFRNPMLIPDSKTLSAPVSLVDVMPTVLDILNMEAGNWGGDLCGQSLVPLMAGREKEGRDLLYFETLLPYFDYGWAGLRGVRRERLKYIAAGEPELYDTKEDPQESRNLYAEEKGEGFQRAMLDLVEKTGMPHTEDTSSELDAETRARLSELGYSSGAFRTSLEGNPFAGPDPKSRIWMQSAMFQAFYLYLQGRHEDALESLEKLYEEDPSNPTLLLKLGMLSSDAGMHGAAEKYFRELIAIQPEHYQAWVNLGVVLGQRGRTDEAFQSFEKALELNPNAPDALCNLALLHLKRNEISDAEAALKRVIEVDPKMTEALTTLGSLYANQGKYREAIPFFQQALTADPKLQAAYDGCAKCYFRLKEYDKAAGYLEQARRQGLDPNPGLRETLKRYRGRKGP